MAIEYQPSSVMAKSQITCDRCAKTARFDGQGPSMCDAYDFLSFRDTGGYASVHMDGQRWSIDLCGSCTIEVLGEWIQKEERP